jgi:hypothetical protein
VKDRRDGSYVHLDNFGNNFDLLAIFNQFTDISGLNPCNDRTNKLMFSTSGISLDGRVISGIVEKGDYGYESALINVNSQTISHRRSTQEAEMLPFFFLLNMPLRRDEGILILQKTGRSGIKTPLYRYFKDHFSSICTGYAIEFNPLVPEELINQYLNNGSIISVNFVSFSYSRDIADAFNCQDHLEDERQVQLIVSTKGLRFPFIERIREVISNNRPLNRFVELRDFEYNTVKLVLNVGGNQRTIDLRDMHKIKPNYDISSEVRVDPNGHPNMESIREIALNLLDEICRGMAMDRG